MGALELAYGQAEWLCCIKAVAASEWGLKSYKMLKPLLEKPMIAKLTFKETHSPAAPIALVHKLFNPDKVRCTEICCRSDSSLLQKWH